MSVAVSVGTEAWLIESWVGGEDKVWLLLGREDGLARLGHLGLLALGEADNTACNSVAHTFTETALTIVCLWVFGLVEIVFSLVEDHGASDNGVGSAEVGEEVSVLVLGVSVEAALDVLEVTDASVVDVEMRVTVLGTEWVIDVAGRLATVLQITVLVNLEGMEARLDVLELSDDGGKIMRLLSELKGAFGVRVAEEIELAGGNDLLFLLWGRLPVVIDGLNIPGLDITGADSAAANPWEAIRLLAVATVALVVARGAVSLVVVVALLRSSGAHGKGASESDLGEHYYDF